VSNANSLLPQALGAWTAHIEGNNHDSFAAFCELRFPQLGVIEVRGPGGDRDIDHEVTPSEAEALLAMALAHGMMIPPQGGQITLEIGGTSRPYIAIIINMDEPGTLAAATLMPDPDAHT
jgi:hypothetical protein